MSEAKRLQLATTFTEAEVKALDALMSKVRAGGDASVIVRDPAIASAHAKFLRMRRKAQS
jgi:hypothetical protein